MLRRLPILLLSALLFSGCALFRPAQKTVAETPSTASVSWEDAPAEPAPRIVTAPGPVIVPVEEPEPLPEPEPEAEPAIFSFAEKETQHVRYAATPNNPFTDTQEITIDLDALQKQFCYPLQGKHISPYGPRGRSYHTGMDIKAAPNDTIRAAFAGTVRMSKLYSSYGNVIVICHPNGLETVYAHQTRNLVAPNQTVQAGDPIGLAGRTGRATTEHLHFEVRVAGDHFNPTLIVDPDNRCLKSGTLHVYKTGNGIRASNTALSASELAPKVASTDPGKASTAESPAVATASAQYHTIKSGDTLGAIARKYGTTVNKLCQLNNITATTLLQINRRLRVK